MAQRAFTFFTHARFCHPATIYCKHPETDIVGADPDEAVNALSEREQEPGSPIRKS